jgi:hypothetical protein
MYSNKLLSFVFHTPKSKMTKTKGESKKSSSNSNGSDTEKKPKAPKVVVATRPKAKGIIARCRDVKKVPASWVSFINKLNNKRNALWLEHVQDETSAMVKMIENKFKKEEDFEGWKLSEGSKQEFRDLLKKEMLAKTRAINNAFDKHANFCIEAGGILKQVAVQAPKKPKAKSDE